MNIGALVSEYVKVKATLSAAEKREKELKAAILDFAKGAEGFETDDYTVIIKETASKRLDTKALYKDFPDIKDVYTKVSVSQSIVTAEKAAAKVPA